MSKKTKKRKEEAAISRDGRGGGGGRQGGGGGSVSSSLSATEITYLDHLSSESQKGKGRIWLRACFLPRPKFFERGETSSFPPVFYGDRLTSHRAFMSQFLRNKLNLPHSRRASRVEEQKLFSSSATICCCLPPFPLLSSHAKKHCCISCTSSYSMGFLSSPPYRVLRPLAR